jgi:addiction module HigA family antidote
MKNPIHPGELIKANLDQLGLSTGEAASAMRITCQALHSVIKGRRAVSAEMAVRLQGAFGRSADFWLRLQAAYDLAKVRRSGRIEVRRLDARVGAPARVLAGKFLGSVMTRQGGLPNDPER